MMLNKKKRAYKININYYAQILLIIFVFCLGYVFERVTSNLFLETSFSNSIPLLEFQDKSQNFPNGHFLLTKNGFLIEYDGRLKQASWVYEDISKESLKGEVNRREFNFSEDLTLPNCVRATLKDYEKSGYDRRHLSPAANHKSCKKEMKDCFLLSNMSPQHPQFNRGYWAKLEEYVRKLVITHGRIVAISGPLFIPNEEPDGKKYITYQVIGENNIAVPTHYFKIIKTPKGNEVYVVPNKKIDSSTSLEQFKSTVEKVQRCSGVIFNNV